MHTNVGWLALVLAGTAGAQDGAAPARETLLVRAEHVIVAPGRVLDAAQVLVRDGRIVAVGQDLEAPAGARVLEGRWVCAGFIDPWSALGMAADGLAELNATAATRSIDGFDPFSLDHLRREALRAGVTSARVQLGAQARIGGLGAVVRLVPGLGRDEAVVAEHSNLWMSAGLSLPTGMQFVETPDGFQMVSGNRAQDPFDRVESVDRIVSALQAGRNYLIAQNEHRHELEDWKKKIAEKEAELEKESKKAKKDREKAQKDAEEKGKPFEEKKYKEDKKPATPRFDEDNEVIARAVDGRLPLLIAAEREAEIRALLAGTASHGRLRLVLAGGSEAVHHATELAERRIPVLVWPAPLGRGRPDELEAHDLSLAGRLSGAGVRVLLGSGGRDPSATRDLPLLAGLAVAHGLPSAKAFEALTLGAARALDVADRLGTVEAGKDADLLILDGPPLASTTNVRFTISSGRVVVTPEN
ncbi:MAG: amidohydrolase family protein [Planctomycetes bacterium]|nr:amidohydrolase family protein [Planctomycetota bacterium]